MLDAVAYQHADRLGAGPDSMLGSPLVEGRQFAGRENDLNLHVLLFHSLHLHNFIDCCNNGYYGSSMSDPFSDYGEQSGYRSLPKKQAKEAKGPSELEKRTQEQSRLFKAYKRWKRQQAKDMFSQEPRLKDFRRYLKTVGPGDGDELVGAIRASWLPESSEDVRMFALRLVSDHCDKLNLRLGFEPMEDPLWDEPPSVFFHVRDILSYGRI